MSNFIHPYTALLENADRFADRPALGALKLGNESYDDFKILSWKETLEKVNQYALFLQSLGLKRGDAVAIQARNQASWVLFDWAAITCGFIVVPLFTQSLASEVEYILKEAEVKYLFTDERSGPSLVSQLSVAELEERSKEFNSSDFVPELGGAQDLATIIYTSGTTGEPKGVMHHLGGIYLAIKEAMTLAQVTEVDRMFSYLPLSHVFERAFCGYGGLYSGACIYFIDHVEKVSKYLTIVRPTTFAAVPRIWDVIKNKLERELAANKFASQILMRLPLFLRKPILSRLIKKRLGLDDARLLVSGAAKLNKDTALRLEQFGIRVIEGYGLTETFCISTFNHPDAPVLGAVGKPFSSVSLKIAEDGEILLKAAHHFSGYYKKPMETNEAIKEGWFHTGDIGVVDDAGTLFITDRKKDIFKTTNGKYVAPQPIELQFKTHPSVQEVMVVGADRPYCVAICTIQDHNITEEEMTKLLDRVNSNLPVHEKIHSLAFTLRSWSVDDGQLTPSMKLKRREILKRYQMTIDSLYSSRDKLKFIHEESNPIERQTPRAYSCV